MDTIRVIREKVEVLSSTASRDGLMAVVKHLEVAEEHYSRGKKNDDQDSYTDVIYRANHAFEGILKEAYTVLADKDPKDKQTHQIEKYLSDNKVFKPRVTELFTQYRTQWRNPSTHEHQLFFNQQEAFLSILSVTSFVSILIDQMIEKAAFDNEKSIETSPDKEEIKKMEKMPLLDKITYLLPSFYKQMQLRPSEEQIQNESQLTGRLHAFLDTSIPDIKVEVEPSVNHKGIWYRADFILSRDEEKVILEVKRMAKSLNFSRERIEYQMLALLRAANIPSGIVFIYPEASFNKRKEYDHIEVTHPDQEHIIVFVIPRNMKGNTEESTS